MAIKTHPTDVDVDAFLAAVTDARRREDAQALTALLREITGEEPRMWGPTMIGFGSKAHTNTTGTNDWFLIGLSPRTAALAIYGVWNSWEPDARIEQLGPHTKGKSCVYVKNLSALDPGMLRTLLTENWERESASG